MRTLLITDRKFWEEGNGANTRIKSLINNLGNKFELSVLYLGDFQSENKKNKIFNKINNFYDRQEWRVRIRVKIKNIIKKVLPNLFLTKITKKEITLKNYESEAYRSYFQKVFNELKPEVIIIEYIYLAYLLDSLDPSLKKEVYKIIDTHDVQSDRYEEFKKSNIKGALKITIQEEKKILEKFDLILAINERDKIKFQKYLKKEIITVLYPGKIKKIETNIKNEVFNIGFVGGEAYPNIEGIQFFIDNVFVKIMNKYNVRLNIYGNVSKYLKKDYPNIITHGFTKNNEKPYLENQLIINPMNLGV